MSTFEVERPAHLALVSDADEPIISTTFDLLGYHAQLTASRGAAYAAVRAVMRGFPPSDDDVTAAARYTLIATDDEKWQVTVNDEVVHTGDNLTVALGTLEWHMVTAALGQRSDVFHVHGASLCTPTRRAGVMLVGGSGNGKTTLTLGLMLRGFSSFGDDVALLDPKTLELQPFRRAFHVSEDTWQLVTAIAGPLPRENDPAGYFSPPQWAEWPVPVRWILFLELRRGQKPELVRLSAGDAATSILGQTLSLAGAPRVALSTTARLTERAECYRLISGDLEESIATIQRLVAADPAAPPR